MLTYNLMKTTRASFIVLHEHFIKEQKTDAALNQGMGKEDAELLKSLYEKMKNQCDQIHGEDCDLNSEVDQYGKCTMKKRKDMHMETLNEILLKHGIKQTEEVRESLFAWKKEY